MKVKLIGVGAAGNKAVCEAIERGVVNTDDTVIINSTSKDFPVEYEGAKIMLSDTDTGCGKERRHAKLLLKEAMNAGKFNNLQLDGYEAAILVSSVEGGTGSGTTPTIAKFIRQVYNKNVHIIAFTGFEDDVRGLSNTVEFFKEIDPTFVVQAISNASFLSLAGNNKIKAEELANKDMCERVRVISGMDFIPGRQNIDDTDINKLSNTSGYMIVGKKEFIKPLETVDDFEKIIKNLIYKNSSVASKDTATRLGVILNIDPASEDAIDFSFESIRRAYGKPYEFFLQEQWDGKKEYIAFIASGMKMPIDELEAIYNRYKEESEKVDKASDEFFTRLNQMEKLDTDNSFDMLCNETKQISPADFIKDFFG